MNIVGDERAELVNSVEHLFQQVSWQGRQQFARRAEAFGLTVPQFAVLAMVGRMGPGATMGEIAESLQLPPSSMTSITDRLVRQGWVERGALPADRRAVVASITQAGQDLVAEIEAARHRDLVAMLEGISDDELRLFGIILARLLDGIERVLTAPAFAAGPDQTDARGEGDAVRHGHRAASHGAGPNERRQAARQRKSGRAFAARSGKVNR
jgi:DNA-binding MarR family transcriptional regulator